MTPDEFTRQMQRVRREHPVWFDLPSDNSPTEAELGRVESELGATLPENFVWFLREFGGGDFAFARTYSGDPSSDLYIQDNQPEPSVPNFVAVGDDGTGNLFGFRIVAGRCVDEVVFWNHEEECLGAGRYGDFLDFLARQAFSRGERAASE